MALPQSGNSITMVQIANEFSDPPPFSLSEFYRGGARVPASASTDIPTGGAISMRSFYGAAAGGGRVTINLNINYDTLWYNVEQYATSTAGYIRGLSDINVTIASDVRVGASYQIPVNPGLIAPGSTSPTFLTTPLPAPLAPFNAAMVVPVNISNPTGLGAGNKVTINNNGHIVGFGGISNFSGPGQNGGSGQQGGTALYVSSPITLNLAPNALIGGGGGGGGQGGQRAYSGGSPKSPFTAFAAGGAGGQGAGTVHAPSGNPENPFNFSTYFTNIWPSPGTAASAPFMPLGSSAYTAGAGVVGNPSPVGPAGAGGPGGFIGSSGTAGTPASTSGGTAGIAGVAIIGTSNIGNWPVGGPTNIVGPTSA